MTADGIPEDLYEDIRSVVDRHIGNDGQSDETNDWVTDLMSEISPLIARVLAETQPKVLAEGVTSEAVAIPTVYSMASFCIEAPAGTRVAVFRGALTIHHRELYANSTSFHQGIDQLANWLTVWIPAMATAAQEADAEIQRRMDALQQMDRLR